MPQAVPAAVAWIGSTLLANTTIGAFLVMNATAVASAAMLVGGLAYSSSKARQARQQAKDQYNAAQVDREATVSSSVAARELVLGRVRKGGVVFYRGSTGAFQKDMYIVIALAGHEIDAVEQIYLNDVPVTLNVNGYVTDAPYNTTPTVPGSQATGAGTTVTLPATYVPGTATAYVYNPGFSADSGESAYTPTGVVVVGLVATTEVPDATVNYQYLGDTTSVKINVHLGAPGQTADADLVAAFPADWSSANTVEGVAYLTVKLPYSEQAFPSGVPAVTAVVRGAKVYDPRTATTAWSDNPALLMRYVYQHPRFGKAVVTSGEDARIIAEANACDTLADYTTSASTDAMGAAVAAITESVALYRANVVAPFGTPARDLLDDLSQAMGGSWAFSGGELHMKSGTYTAPAMTLTEEDLAVVIRNGASESQKPISISVHRERAQKFNTVKVSIWDSARDYKRVDLTPQVGAALVARDGVELVQEVTYPAIGYAPQALHVAGIMMRDSRDALVVELPVKLRAYPLKLFETVNLTLPRYGWSAKTFMLLGRSWNSDGSLQLTLKETSAAITQMDAEFLPQGHAPNTNLPKPWEVADVGPLTISTGTPELLLQSDGTVVSRMRVSWTQVADAAVVQNGHVEVQYRPAVSTEAWTSLVVQGVETSVATADVKDGVYYTVRARATTSAGVGEWGEYTDVQVLGKSAPPQDVVAFSIAGDTLNWTPVSDLDLAGYLLRFNYGSNFTWDTATPMHVGVITESPYVLVTRPSGAVTLMIKAIDTSGNVSVNAAAVATNLADPPVANIVETVDFSALGYPGTLTSCTVIGAELVGNGQGVGTLVDYGLITAGASTNLDYGLITDPVTTSEDFGDSGAFDAMTYLSHEVVISQALEGSLATLAISAVGDSFRVEYRLSGPGSFYEADDESFYGADGDSFYGAPGPWVAWPGQLSMTNDTYQFRVQIAAGASQGRILSMVLTVDAPDITETVDDLVISAGGTSIPFTKPFTNIKNVQVTLQTNGSGAETVEVDKTDPLAPVIHAFNSAHTAVSGASVDITLKGY